MNRAYYHLVIAAIFFAVVLSVYLFWNNTLMRVSGEVASLASDITTKNKTFAETIVAEKELTKLSTEESTIQGYFVKTADVVPFLEGMQTLGSSVGAKVTIVSVSTNPLPRQHLELALRISGTFDAVVRAVGLIEYSPYDVTTTSLTLSSDPSTDPKVGSVWSGALTLQIGTASSTVPVKTATTTP